MAGIRMLAIRSAQRPAVPHWMTCGPWSSILWQDPGQERRPRPQAAFCRKPTAPRVREPRTLRAGCW